MIVFCITWYTGKYCCKHLGFSYEFHECIFWMLRSCRTISYHRTLRVYHSVDSILNFWRIHIVSAEFSVVFVRTKMNTVSNWHTVSWNKILWSITLLCSVLVGKETILDEINKKSFKITIKFVFMNNLFNATYW